MTLGITVLADSPTLSHRLAYRAGRWHWECVTYPARVIVLKTYPPEATRDECARAVGRTMGRAPDRYPVRRWLDTAASDAAYYARIEEATR